MSDIDPVSIKQALRAQLGSQRSKISNSAKGRRALEKEANHPHDARLSRKATRGTTVQLNVEIREDLKQALANAARDHRKKIWEIVEAGIEAELRKLGAKS
jgi:hypothetical protein